MSVSEINWIERGKEHQAKGDFVDAIICFDKASREDQAPEEAYFYLGQAWWAIGAVDKAYAAWEKSGEKNSQFLPCQLALSEALLHLGDIDGAAAQAKRVADLVGVEPRSQAVRDIHALRNGAVEKLRGLAQLAQAVPAIFQDVAFARALAGALQVNEGKIPQDEKKYFLDKMFEAGAVWPPVLTLALLRVGLLADAENEERYKARAQQLLQQEVIPAEDIESLRSFALLLVQRGGQAEAQGFIEKYLVFQKEDIDRRKLQALVLPLRWTKRTAGKAARIAFLLPAWGMTREEDRLRFKSEWGASRFSGRAHSDLWAVSDATQWQTFLGAVGGEEVGVVVRTLPPGFPAAQVVLFDYDAWVGLAGLSWPFKSFFFERPARALWQLNCFSSTTGFFEGPEVQKTFESLDSVAAAVSDLERQLPIESSLSSRAFVEERDAALRAHQQGDTERAKDIYEKLLLEQPGMGLLHYLMAMLARDLNAPEMIEQHFEAAVSALPDYAHTYHTFAEYLMVDDAQRAREVAEKGLTHLPMAQSLFLLLGRIELRQGESYAAESMFRQALIAEPMNARAHFGMGIVLHLQGRPQEAARSYQRALLFEPGMLEAHFNLGSFFQEIKQFAAAQNAFRFVLSKDPRHARAYLQLGEVLARSGQLREWFANFSEFRKHCPKSILMASQALEACQFMGDYKGVESFLNGLRHSAFEASDGVELIDALDLLQYQLLFFDVEPELSLQMAKLYDGVMHKTFGAPIQRSEQRRLGKWRVGYLSADLRDHVMGRMVWQATQHHDKEQFEIFFYSIDKRQDALTEKLKSVADHFHVLAGLGEREAAEKIAGDDLDILVDLSTNTEGSKPGILALKPARVQITHIASAGTLGLSTIDFKLTDRYADVQEMQEFQLETFLPMEGCVYPYQHIEATKQHSYNRKALGVSDDAVLIGAFVVPTKLSARCMGLWKKVLNRIPKAKLVFSPLSPTFGQVFKNVMKSAGIPEDRYLFLPIPTDLAMRQARYAVIDFVLDPMPFGNVNGTLEPLDAGVPVVTLVGRRHGERTSYSILKNLGETRTVAMTGEEYVSIAQKLSEDHVFMADVRASIQRGLKDSLLVDMKQHCRHLEDAYLRALEMKVPAVVASAGL